MACLRLIMMALLASVPAMAQPIIIPLEPQPKQQPQQENTPGPVASAPPVAPPIAQPSVQETGVARGENSGQQEEAYQPDDKKPR